ncbi:unnamed protein product [Rangifer tarandus platyrhynchus]|uniref:Uncharacterized protein n=2 Tax=Rangifer tarandus platyrhynchus TaxID=3082113 RepID=A0AC59ZPU7_RANTA|nr:unnamed protein product [Rangifer tarandus platyrhynchus]
MDSKPLDCRKVPPLSFWKTQFKCSLFQEAFPHPLATNQSTHIHTLAEHPLACTPLTSTIGLPFGLYFMPPSIAILPIFIPSSRDQGSGQLFLPPEIRTKKYPIILLD